MLGRLDLAVNPPLLRCVQTCVKSCEQVVRNGAEDQYDDARESPLKGNISKVASQVVMCDGSGPPMSLDARINTQQRQLPTLNGSAT